MSLRFRDNNGNETPISGLNGASGQLIPSVSLMQSGTVNFSCEANSWNTVAVTFTTPMPDTDYLVITESGATEYVHVQNVITKQTTGFTMIIWNRDAISETGTINWTAFKLMTNESRALDEAQIAQNTTDITTINSKIPSYASSSEKLAYVEYIPSTNLYSTWTELLELIYQHGAGYWTGTVYIGKWYTYTAKITIGVNGYWLGSFLAKCSEDTDLVGASKIYGSGNTWVVTHYATQQDAIAWNTAKAVTVIRDSTTSGSIYRIAANGYWDNQDGSKFYVGIVKDPASAQANPIITDLAKSSEVSASVTAKTASSFTITFSGFINEAIFTTVTKIC